MSFIAGLFGAGQQDKENPYTVGNDQLSMNQTNQNQLVGQLQQQAAGNGPSVANAFLKNSAEQAGANAAGMAAANRGNNSGLALRNAMQTGQQALQGAAAQGAQAKMQEQLNAQQQLGGQLNTMQGQGINSQMAKAQINAQIGANNSKRSADAWGGAMGGLGSALSGGLLAKGGEVTPVLLAQGGDSSSVSIPTLQLAPITDNPFAFKKPAPSAPLPPGGPAATGLSTAAPGDRPVALSNVPMGPQTLAQAGPQSAIGKFVSGLGHIGNSALTVGKTLGGGIINEPGKISSDLKSQFAKGGKATKNMKTGGHVPGKPKVGGTKDSYSNDTVPALLSPGEIVIPRSISQKPNAAELAAKFVAATKAKKGK